MKNSTKIGFGKVFYQLILPIVCLIIGGIVVHYWTIPKSRLEIYTAFTDSTPYRPDASGSLHLDYYSEEKNRFDVNISNTGNKTAINVYIDIRSNVKDLFLKPIIIFDPPLIDEFLYKNETVENSERIYYRLKELPANGRIKLFVEGKDHFNERDIYISVISDGNVQKVIRKEIKFVNASDLSFINYESLPMIFPGNLYAQTKNDTLKTSIQNQSHGSGIFLGGYDPVVFTNGIFRLLQKYRIITKDEAIYLKKSTEESNTGMKFGGVDVLKFDEEVLNLMIKKGILNLDQANQIIDRSKKVGGILINGYNVIQLKYEILNFLLKNNYVTLSDAQAVIDNAKSN